MGIPKVRPTTIVLALLPLAGFGLWYSSIDSALAHAQEPKLAAAALVGVVEVDETKMVRVSARLRGRIDKLHVNIAGQHVKKGEPLAELYSPDLVVTVQNLLDARKNGNQALEQNARERLALWGLSKDDADEIVKSGKEVSHLTVRSPVSGHVLRKHQLEGSYVNEGAALFELADLTTVWIEADTKDQRDLLLFKAKLPARVTANALPKREFRGEVLGLFQDEKTRLLKVRFAVKNPGDELLPGMLALVKVDAKLKGEGKEGPLPPGIVRPVQLSPYREVLQGKTDSKLKELLAERSATLQKLVKQTQADYLAGRVSFDRLHQAQRAMLHAELELCDSDKERITVLEKVAALAKDFEKNALERYKSGTRPVSDALLATVGRLEAEIALERAKTKAAQAK